MRVDLYQSEDIDMVIEILEHLDDQILDADDLHLMVQEVLEILVNR